MLCRHELWQEQLNLEELGGPSTGTPRSREARPLAPGRTVNDPVPVKVLPVSVYGAVCECMLSSQVDTEAIHKLRNDVIPFLLKRIEAVEAPSYPGMSPIAVSRACLRLLFYAVVSRCRRWSLTSKQ